MTTYRRHTERQSRDILLIFSIVFLLAATALTVSTAAVKAAGPTPASTEASSAGSSLLPARSASLPDCNPDWVLVSDQGIGAVTRLSGVAAVSSGDAWAVGYYHGSSSDQTLIQHWDGTAWTTTSSPNVGSYNNYLSAVKAVSANDIWAVGSHGTSTGSAQTLILHWDGATWSVIPSPSVDSSASYLYGLDALTTNDAWAVGFSVQNSLAQTLIEHWDGTAWSIIPSPNSGTSGSALYAVTAVAANDVWAVGHYQSGFNYLTLIEHWDGTAWSVTPSPNGATNFNFLYGVSAASANNIWAAGYYYSGGLQQTLIEHWDGTAWSITLSPDPGTNHILRAVEAASANDAWAVGTYDDSSANNRTLVLHWNGTVWSTVSSASVGSTGNILYGVSAASMNDVWAVGYSGDSNADQPLVVRYEPCQTTATPTPGTPSPTPTPTQTAASPTPVPTECVPQWTVVDSPNGGAGDNELRAVTAISSSDIWAVGYYGTNQAGFQSLTEHWDGSTWSVVPSPNPSSYLNWLLGVTAISPNDVWAVGEERVADMQGDTFTIHWDGSTWSMVSSPNPEGGIYNLLLGVSAVSSNDVWAVGFYETFNDNKTLTMHWDGTQWSLVASPNPSVSYSYLYAVTAISSNDVWAVGTFDTTQPFPFAMHWDGIEWDAVAVPNVGTGANELLAVTALSSNDLWAVGSYSTGSGGSVEHTLVEHWDGSHWSVVPSPDAGNEYNTLDGLAALSPNDVWAVGQYHNQFGNDHTLAEHWDGNSWSVVASPSGVGTNWLLGVTALSYNDVWAVGLHGNPYQTLTEHYSSPCVSPTPPATGTPTNTAISTQTATVTATATPVASGTATAVNSPVATGTPTQTVVVTPTATVAGSTPTACTIAFDDVPSGHTFYSYIQCLACRGIVNGYPDGTFRPGNNVTRGQAAKIIANSADYQDLIPPDTQTFNDVPPGSTFWVYIERVSLHGAISGYPCGAQGEPCPGRYFRPADNLTRGQLAKIDSEAFGYNDPIPPDTQTFNDVPPASTFWVYIERLALHSVISGYPCGGEGEPCPGVYYRPGNDITRGEASKVVANTFFPQCQPVLPR